MIIIPYFVTEFCEKQAKTVGYIRVDVNVFDKEGGNFLYKHGLTFGADLMFHGTDGTTLSMMDYITKTLTYSRKHITICLNGKLLSDIKPLLLPPPETPPEINLGNT